MLTELQPQKQDKKTPLTIMPPPTCDKYKAKKYILGHAYLTPPQPWPLTFWHQNMMRSSLLQSLLVVKVWPNSVNKYPRYLANNVCSGLTNTHGRMNEWTHKHSGNIMPPTTTLVEA